MFGFGSFGEYAFGDAPTVGATPVFEDSWHQPLAQPVRYRIAPAAFVALIAWAGISNPVDLTHPETVTADRWYKPVAEPVLSRRSLPTAQYPFLSLVKGDPFPETVTADRWVPPLAEPVRYRRSLGTAQYPFLSLVKAAPFQETVTEDRWHQPLSEPLRRRRQLPISQHQFLIWSPWPIVLEEGVVTFEAVASLSARPTSLYITMLEDKRSQMAYTIEFRPWRNSDRGNG